MASVTDKPLAPFQVELLDLAAKATTSIPVKPNLKDRSRAQEGVVGACLQLDQPVRALALIEKIDDWRRGIGYADLAYYCAQHGDKVQAQELLARARKVADRPDDEDSQDWQRDRIRGKIAKAQIALGETVQASQVESAVEASEAGYVAMAKAKHADPSTFDDQLKALDADFATGSFDRVKNAQEACAQLWDRFYEDESRRSLLEARIEGSSSKVPAAFRIDVILRLAAAALEHQDRNKALELMIKAQALLDGTRLNAEAKVPLMARVAAACSHVGDLESARRIAAQALELFDAERETIPNVYRASLLRPVAEAYHSMGDPATARSIYKRAVEEGVDSPNSRPRAEDLSATCCSIALTAVEPDAALRSRVLEIFAGLRPPW